MVAAKSKSPPQVLPTFRDGSAEIRGVMPVGDFKSPSRRIVLVVMGDLGTCLAVEMGEWFRP